MSDLLWQKPGVTVDARIQKFLAGDDVILDREFFLHDIAASKAHAEGLQRIGILSADELSGLQRELATLADDFRSGAFVLDRLLCFHKTLFKCYLDNMFFNLLNCNCGLVNTQYTGCFAWCRTNPSGELREIIG